MSKILIAYIPVLHEGYRKLLSTHKGVKTLYLWGEDLISEEDYLIKEKRALSPELIKKSLDSWKLPFNIKILGKNLSEIRDFKGEIIMPDDDISHNFSAKYLIDKKIIFSPIFLRWDRKNSVRKNKIANDQVITSSKFSKKMITCAKKEGEKSSDWWRQVGAVIVKNGKIILSGHNHHVPSPHTPYVDGDPRNCFHKGENLELSTAVHAEAGLIAEAARQGISLEGAEIYVSVFPCPPCAKLIAYSGIKRIYYKEGYGVLDGEGIMKEKGVEIYFVK